MNNTYSTSEIKEIIRAKNEAVNQYEKMRDSIMKDIYHFLSEHRGEGFTSAQISKMFGLPVKVFCSTAEHQTGFFMKGITYQENKYVKLDEEGNPDFDHVITKHHKITVYSARDRSFRRW